VSAHPSPRSGSNRFCSRAAVELFLRENGVEGSSLTPQDAALADATPDVTQKRFTVLFGGYPEHERPRSREQNIVCLNPVAQPYGPNSPGESGLMFLPPATVRFEDNYTSFHVFANMSPPRTQAPTRDRTYRYLGTYTKVPTIRTTVEVDEWLGLPTWVSRSLPLSHTKAGVLPRCLQKVIRLISLSLVVPHCLVVAPLHPYIARRACYACEDQYTQDASAGSPALAR